jgi:hypothetical protein
MPLPVDLPSAMQPKANDYHLVIEIDRDSAPAPEDYRVPDGIICAEDEPFEQAMIQRACKRWAMRFAGDPPPVRIDGEKGFAYACRVDAESLRVILTVTRHVRPGDHHAVVVALGRVLETERLARAASDLGVSPSGFDDLVRLEKRDEAHARQMRRVRGLAARIPLDEQREGESAADQLHRLTNDLKQLIPATFALAASDTRYIIAQLHLAQANLRPAELGDRVHRLREAIGAGPGSLPPADGEGGDDIELTTKQFRRLVDMPEKLIEPWLGAIRSPDAPATEVDEALLAMHQKEVGALGEQMDERRFDRTVAFLRREMQGGNQTALSAWFGLYSVRNLPLALRILEHFDAYETLTQAPPETLREWLNHGDPLVRERMNQAVARCDAVLDHLAQRPQPKVRVARPGARS